MALPYENPYLHLIGNEKRRDVDSMEELLKARSLLEAEKKAMISSSSPTS